MARNGQFEDIEDGRASRWNFSPVAATALFAGTTLSRRSLATPVPLAAMLVSDALLGGYGWAMMAVVYGALALPAVIGVLTRGRRVWPVAIGALISSLITPDVKGLLECYVAALPSLKYTVARDLALFCGAASVRRRTERSGPALAPQCWTTFGNA